MNHHESLMDDVNYMNQSFSLMYLFTNDKIIREI